jgi:hypothetical protein
MADVLTCASELSRVIAKRIAASGITIIIRRVTVLYSFFAGTSASSNGSPQLQAPNECPCVVSVERNIPPVLLHKSWSVESLPPSNDPDWSPIAKLARVLAEAANVSVPRVIGEDDHYIRWALSRLNTQRNAGHS